MDRTTGKEFVEENEFNFIPVIVAVALVLITLGKTQLNLVCVRFVIRFLEKFSVVLFLIKRRQLQRTDVLLAGLCDSGKTLLYSLILNGSEIETFTSLKENLGILTLPKGTARLVDLPGHERLRLRLLDTYKSYTKALVYVIDSSVIQKEVKDVAEYVFIILIRLVFNQIQSSAFFTHSWLIKHCRRYLCLFFATNKMKPCQKERQSSNSC